MLQEERLTTVNAIRATVVGQATDPDICAPLLIHHHLSSIVMFAGQVRKPNICVPRPDYHHVMPECC